MTAPDVATAGLAMTELGKVYDRTAAEFAVQSWGVVHSKATATVIAIAVLAEGPSLRAELVGADSVRSVAGER
ncbi:MAG: hypothetical protein JWN95_2312 [Frankiales bacterium]|nr:hypothetical protein [Frankiales bacterium]